MEYSVSSGGNTYHGGVAYMSKAQAAIQRDQNWQEKWQEPHKIQKGVVQTPAPSKEELKASGCAWGNCKAVWQKRLWGPGR